MTQGTRRRRTLITAGANPLGFASSARLANEGRPHGVTGNCVLPGLMATDHVLRMCDHVDEFFAGVIAEQA
ncbi:MAG TPA: hypothetical protein VN238_06625 [Solirubrobacteraceae bacterium]|nr:hypothetical protein [Solirubrobacteraceae bacterium]